MRGILVLAASALLAGLLIVPSGCRKEVPAPPAPAKEEKKEVPVVSAPEKQEEPTAAEVPAGGQPATEVEPVPAAAVAPPPGELDPATCSDKIAVEEARVRREVLPRLRADQEANAQVAEWAAGTAKQLQLETEESDRKRREEHWKEYSACLKDLTGAKAERDPLCVAYVTKDVTACDRVGDALARNQCTWLVRQSQGEAAPMEAGFPQPPMFEGKAMKPRMAEFDPDSPWCDQSFRLALRAPPQEMKNPGFGPPEKMAPGQPQPFPDDLPKVKMLPGSGPDGPSRRDYTPRTWKTLDDCERGGLRLRFGKPLDDAPCRKMIWDKNVLPASEGRTELRLTFVNPFDSPARCTVAISVKGAESETSQRTTFSFGASQTTVQSIFFLAEPGATFGVKPDCTWEKTAEINN